MVSDTINGRKACMAMPFYLNQNSDNAKGRARAQKALRYVPLAPNFDGNGRLQTA